MFYFVPTNTILLCNYKKQRKDPSENKRKEGKDRMVTTQGQKDVQKDHIGLIQMLRAEWRKFSV